MTNITDEELLAAFESVHKQQDEERGNIRALAECDAVQRIARATMVMGIFTDPLLCLSQQLAICLIIGYRIGRQQATRELLEQTIKGD